MHCCFRCCLCSHYCLSLSHMYVTETFPPWSILGRTWLINGYIMHLSDKGKICLLTLARRMTTDVEYLTTSQFLLLVLFFLTPKLYVNHERWQTAKSTLLEFNGAWLGYENKIFHALCSRNFYVFYLSIDLTDRSITRYYCISVVIDMLYWSNTKSL